MALFEKKEKLGANNRPTIVKLGIFTILVIIASVAIVAKLGSIKFFAHRSGYKAVVPSAAGLFVNDSVRIAGVGVGKVTGIHLHDGNALVTFKIDDDIKLRSGTEIGLRWRNLLGQRYLYVYPSDVGRVVKPGHTFEISHARDTPDIGKLLNELTPIVKAVSPRQANAIFRALDQALTGNEGKVSSLFTNAAAISKTVGGLDMKFGTLLDNLKTLAVAVSSRNHQLTETLDNANQLSAVFARRDGSINTLIDQLSALLPKLQDFLDGSTGNITETIANLRKVTDIVAQHRQDLSDTLSELPPGTATLHDFTKNGQYLQGRLVDLCLGNYDPGQSPPGHCLTSDTFSSAADVSGQATAAKPTPASPLAFAATAGSGS